MCPARRTLTTTARGGGGPERRTHSRIRVSGGTGSADVANPIQSAKCFHKSGENKGDHLLKSTQHQLNPFECGLILQTSGRPT